MVSWRDSCGQNLNNTQRDVASDSQWTGTWRPGSSGTRVPGYQWYQGTRVPGVAQEKGWDFSGHAEHYFILHQLAAWLICGCGELLDFLMMKSLKYSNDGCPCVCLVYQCHTIYIKHFSIFCGLQEFLFQAASMKKDLCLVKYVTVTWLHAKLSHDRGDMNFYGWEFLFMMNQTCGVS